MQLAAAPLQLAPASGAGAALGPQSDRVPTLPENYSLPIHAGTMIGGKYEVLQLIGDGGMGLVVAARHVELGEVVALKFLRPETMRSPEVVARFAREARASVRIKSEYVARVLDVGTLPEGVPYIVMEHLEGEDLADVIEKRGALPIKLAVEYIMQACEALAAAHSTGIVHRDVKPENLFLARRSQGMDVIKVLDFGISKVALTGSAFETDVPLVRTTMPLGSPVYMSPEQIRASDHIDARTDIWSLGCVLYELLAGVPPFDAPSVTQLSAMILENEPAPLRRFLPDAPPELEAVLARCLAKDPEDRYADVAELAVALYTFGPRRARISAERCMYMLRGTQLHPPENEISSVLPPPGTHPESASGIPLDYVSSSSKPVVLSQADIVEYAPATSKPKYLAFVALGALLSGVGYLAVSGLMGGQSSAPAVQSAAAAAAVPAGAAVPAPNAQPGLVAAQQARALEPERSSGTLPANAELTVRADSGTQVASEAVRRERPSTGASAPRRAPPRRAAPPPPARKSSPARVDEIDVGF